MCLPYHVFKHVLSMLELNGFETNDFFRIGFDILTFNDFWEVFDWHFCKFFNLLFYLFLDSFICFCVYWRLVFNAFTTVQHQSLKLNERFVTKLLDEFLVILLFRQFLTEVIILVPGIDLGLVFLLIFFIVGCSELHFLDLFGRKCGTLIACDL